MSSKSPAAAAAAAGSLPPELEIVDMDEADSSSDDADLAEEEQPARVRRPESTGFCLAPPSASAGDGTDLESLGLGGRGGGRGDHARNARQCDASRVAASGCSAP